MALLNSRFPQELYDMIIDQGAEDDTALKTYALVCRSFVTPSRKHFFHSVEFVTMNDDVKSRRIHTNFHAILTENPRIASWVNELRIRDISAELDPPESQRPSWIRDDVTVHETLRTLAASRLERFTLETDLYWGSFPVGLKRALLRVFSGDHITYVCLDGLMGLYKSICPAFRVLEDLFLVRVELDADDDTDVVVEAVPPDRTAISWLGMEHVEGPSIGIFLDGLLPPGEITSVRPEFPQLDALHVGPDYPNDVPAIWQVILAARNTLKYFYWEYTNKNGLPSPIDPSPISLAVLPKLIAIFYEVTYYETGEIPDHPDQFSGLLALLNSVRPDNSIASIHITVHFPNYVIASDSVSNYEGWRRLNALLASDMYPQLGEVFVAVYVKTLAATGSTHGETSIDADREKEHKEELEEAIRTIFDHDDILHVSVTTSHYS